MTTETLTGSTRRRIMPAARGPGSRRARQPSHRVPVLAVAHELAVLRLFAAQRAAQRADEVAGVVVHPLAGERGAPAIGAAVAIAGQGAEALAQELALQIGAELKHARNFVTLKSAPSVISPMISWSSLRRTLGSARIASRGRPGGALEGAGRWSHSCRAPLPGPDPSAVMNAATSSRWPRPTRFPTAPAAAARPSAARRSSARAPASRARFLRRWPRMIASAGSNAREP